MEYAGRRILAAAGGGERPVLWTRITTSYPEVTEALNKVCGGRGCTAVRVTLGDSAPVDS
ncbi:hypothetical protein [Rhodococcus opacus]|uniref:hypothetical protein n=1 Tax=Rhodococcus opacus TaxID=37919 RepID=UPI0024730E34|nr:hypothetical protein [Rhodococcus opacus]